MELHAQPILHLGSGTVTQYELLLRMRSGNGELIPPAAFLDVAEKSGLVREIDQWVVRSACRLITAEAERGHPLKLEVNVSGISVSDPDFLQNVEPDLRRLGARAADLVFEITETAAVTDLTNATTFAQRLASYGCPLALDDFGAGFSSYYYLKHLPFDYLKIDGEFIKTLPDSPDDQVFVRATVALAKGLGKHTIAEFVEDRRTLDLLADLGVDYAQGYHVGRPAPLTEHLAARA
jgi:EAL domain-containing protein (putative c-di-GMP-specific phosphodiesterase class I)